MAHRERIDEDDPMDMKGEVKKISIKKQKNVTTKKKR